MKVTYSDGLYKCSRITGPKHNYLGLKLSDEQPAEVLVFARQLGGEACVIDETQMVAAVADGICEVNRYRKKHLFASYIEYVPSDTPDYSAYSHLARAIIETAGAGE